jgi:hypothetical protein
VQYWSAAARYCRTDALIKCCPYVAWYCPCVLTPLSSAVLVLTALLYMYSCPCEALSFCTELKALQGTVLVYSLVRPLCTEALARYCPYVLKPLQGTVLMY